MTWTQTIAVGNVGREPELRYIQSGTAVCDFSLAVNESWTDRQTQEKREKTTWFRVTCWGRLAETVTQYVQKGKLVMVVGTVEANAYVNNAGEAAASLDLTARDVRFLGGRDGTGQAGAYDEFAPPPSNADDIPF